MGQYGGPNHVAFVWSYRNAHEIYQFASINDPRLVSIAKGIDRIVSHLILGGGDSGRNRYPILRLRLIMSNQFIRITVRIWKDRDPTLSRRAASDWQYLDEYSHYLLASM